MIIHCLIRILLQCHNLGPVLKINVSDSYYTVNIQHTTNKLASDKKLYTLTSSY